LCRRQFPNGAGGANAAVRSIRPPTVRPIYDVISDAHKRFNAGEVREKAIKRHHPLPSS